MARRVIGGQVPESPGTLVVQTLDFDSPAKQLDDSNLNFEELYAAAGLSEDAASVEIALIADTYNDDDISELTGGTLDGIHYIDFVPLTVDVIITGMPAASDGQRIIAFNAGMKNIAFSVGIDGTGDPASAAGNQFRGQAGYIATFQPGETFWLVYRRTLGGWLAF